MGTSARASVDGGQDAPDDVAGGGAQDAGDGGAGTLFGINHMIYCGASAIATAAGEGVLADRIGVDPTQDLTEAGGTTAAWFSALAVSGVRGWALLNPHSYGDYTTIDPTAWGDSVVTWFQKYGKGGAYWRSSGGADLGPDAVEVLNEPYGSWFWTNVDGTAYAGIVEATKLALSSHGLGWVKVVASGDVARDESFFSDFETAGGLTYSDGIAIHPYGPVQAAGGWTDGWAGERQMYLNQTFEQQVAAAEAWAPGVSVFMTEGGQNQSEPTADDGDSAMVSATYAAAAYAAYAKTGASDPRFLAVLPYAWCEPYYGILGTPAQAAYSAAIP